jgi:outer membrane protein assembly factor BamB
MARRRRDAISFFAAARDRRRDLTFMDRRRSRRAIWMISILGVAALGIAVYAWVTRSDDGGPSVAGDEGPPPSLLTATPTSTTLAGNPTGVLACTEEAIDWPTFQGLMSRTGCTVTRTITNPRVLWQADVGIQGWLNNPIIAEGLVIVGSAGFTQFEPDDGDGVTALDLATGEERWFFDAELDVNGVAYGDGVVVVAGDEGRVWGLAVGDGRPLWADDLAVAAFGNPLIISGMAVVGDGNGNLTAYDLGTGARRWGVSVSGPIRGGAASDGTTIFVIGEDREAAAVALDGTVLWRQRLSGRGPNADAVRVFAAPTVVDDLVIVALVRESEFVEPALMALDKSDGTVRWRAVDAAGIKNAWGNLRSSPAVVGDTLVYGEPYSNQLVGVDLATGETLWAVETGAFCFPHWPSPAVTSGQAVFARHDGGLYSVDIAEGRVVWSVYVGDGTAVGTFPAGFGPDFCEWQPNTGYSVLSSPAISVDGIVVVGTLEGVLVAIGDEAW